MKKVSRLTALILALVMCISLAACGGGTDPGAGDTGAGDGEGYKIAWSTIYLTPSWQQQTKAMIESRIQKWQDEGLVSEFTVANANGDTSQQIAQIENLIAQEYDAIILIAGSSTALNNVVEKAYDAGIVIINIDSLVTTDKVTSKVNTSAIEWGELCAQWMMDQIDGTGKVIVFNGPAGVAVSDERQQGALNVLEQYPDVEVVEIFSEYNEGPARDAIMPALDAHPDVAGVIALGGAQASAALKTLQDKNMALVPITGENYNAFLKEWDKLKDDGFTSFCVGQPNWLGTLAVDQAIRALQGESVGAEVIVPLPTITPENLSDHVPNDLPDDSFSVKELTEDEITQYLK